MKRFVIAGLLIASAALTPAYAKNKITVTQDQRAKISTYVSQQKPKQVSFQVKPNRGSKIESSVALMDVPSEWGADLGKYKYVYTNNRVLFVNPDSRAVVDAIKVSK